MNIWIPEAPVLEKIFRAGLVYVFLFVALRLLGKRQLGEMAPFDLIVLLIISNVVQNAMIGRDDSLTGGLIGAATILALNYLVEELSFRFKKVRRLTEGEPALLVHNGRVLRRNMRKERLTEEELLSSLRKNGVADISRVHAAMLEPDGRISVIEKK